MTDQIKRTASQYMEDQIGVKHPVLDHGFVSVVDYMGNDQSVVQAARVSYGTGTKTSSKDEGLIRYMRSHWHNTPFEMAEIKLHVKLPVFVARQWIRHRTANVNEYSARYSIMDREFYVPEICDIAPQSTSNKQGRAGGYPIGQATDIQSTFTVHSEQSYDVYAALIDENGVNLARETGRMALPTNIYTQWYWKVDVHNLMHFLQLRADPHAQLEIRKYADVILNILQGWMPITYQAFMDYNMNAKSLSAMEVDVIKELLATGPARTLMGEKAKSAWGRMTGRERKAFIDNWGELQ
jgi:thymidylate synthase (FAD)